MNEGLCTNIFKGRTEEEIKKEYNRLWLKIIRQSEIKNVNNGLQGVEKRRIIDATASQFHSANLDERGAN